MANENQIEINIPAGVPARDWQRLALKYGRAACDAAGLEFSEAHIYCALPEHGRCMVKPTGRENFYSYG